MDLSMDFLPRENIPAPLFGALDKAWGQLLSSIEQSDNLAAMRGVEIPSEVYLALEPHRRIQLAKVLTVSRFAGATLVRHPEWLASLDSSGELDAALAPQALKELLDEGLEAAENEAAMHAVVRRYRRARMLGIVWRDLTRPQGVDAWNTSAAVSRLAEVCVEGVLSWLERHFEPRWGLPAPRRDGSEQRLVVLGMGKLGAGELNLSSDIDLIFAYPEKGETTGGRKALDHVEYFTKLGQKLIAALDAVTSEGFVFRVDMRLRPLGDGGPLVGSFASLASYYQDQGREWERYAMLKARPIAGDIDAGYELLSSLRPFVYRKYLDFGAIESLRELKAMINREVKRKGMESNIKLGSGGIREVEFVVQVFQLIRGGCDTELQVTSLKTALQRLAELGLLPQKVVDELMPDYIFLRDLEHAIQALEDRQTQALPTEHLDQERVAFALGMDGWDELQVCLRAVRDRVRRHFDAVISQPEDDIEEEEEHSEREVWSQLWRGEPNEEEALLLLADGGFEDPDVALKRIRGLSGSRQVQAMQRVAYERLDALMPMLIEAVVASEMPDTALERVLPLIEAVLRRTAYLALLRENPDALGHLMRLCSASPWIAEQIARYPVLLDELLTPDTLYTPADKERLADELRQILARIPEEDEESQLEALRVFKHAQVLHVAASDIAGTRHLMKVSDFLTYIAEVVLDAVLAMAWRTLTRKHGFPIGHDGERAGEVPEFLIVGYGKLGGIELGYGSDLDLVFLHDGASQGETDGPRPIDNSVFFTRLGQRIIHLLSAVTPAGSLYEVDMRLRPSGNSGLLVSSMTAFAEYQREQAWTWEHQALVRARVVSGHERLAQHFESIRKEILGRQRDRDELRKEVVQMRHKMRDHLGSKNTGSKNTGSKSTEENTDGPGATFDLKHDAGGMIDIEFMCQYAVLALSHYTPELLRYSDNMRILEALEETGYLQQEEAVALRQAYLDARAANHRMALTRQPARGDVEAFRHHREAVTATWHKWLESSSESLS